MNFKITREYLTFVCLICVTSAWNQLIRTETKRPFDFEGTLKQRFALSVVVADPNAHIVCSPISLYLLLGKLALGAVSPTIEELELAIGIFGERKLRDSYRQLIKDLREVPGAVTISIAGRLFVDDRLKINKMFCEESIQVFESCLETIDYNSPSKAAEAINTWVSNQTRGMIPTMVTPRDIQSASSLIMINAIYFSGTWKTKFEPAKSEIFHTMRGDHPVDMMTVKASFYYRRSDELECHILEIPYDGDEASFIMVLPLNRGALRAVIQNILTDIDKFRAEMLKMEKEYVKLKMPKFKIETSLELTDVLIELGISSMFSKKQSGLTKITASGNVYVSNVFQKAYIEVNEMGTEAAAATGSFMQMSILPAIRINANYPFLFFVESRSQQLFAGTYNGPDWV